MTVTIIADVLGFIAAIQDNYKFTKFMTQTLSNFHIFLRSSFNDQMTDDSYYTLFLIKKK